MTAAELQAELAKDPAYQALLREKEVKRAALEAELAADEASLVKELRDAGVNVTLTRLPGQKYQGAPQSVWDLVNSDTPYPLAIPILVQHLQSDHVERTKEGIARALAVPEARGTATAAVIQEFCRITDSTSTYKWVLGKAIAETATPETVSSIVELLRDKRHGRAREWLPLALIHLPQDDAKAALELLGNDPDVRERADEALDKIRKIQS